MLIKDFSLRRIVSHFTIVVALEVVGREGLLKYLKLTYQQIFC